MLNIFGVGATKRTIALLAVSISFLTTSSASAAVLLQGHLMRNAPQSVERLNRWLPEPGFDGVWSAQTHVTQSTCEAVKVGVEVNSHVRFSRANDGSILAGWEQPGWVVSNQQFQSLSPTEAAMSRSNVAIGENAGCTEDSHDYYRQIAEDKILVSSYVDIYEDGSYLGRYQTESILTRLVPSGLPTMCRGELSKEKDNGLCVPTHDLPH